MIISPFNVPLFFCPQQLAMRLQFFQTQKKGEDMISMVMRIPSHRFTEITMITEEDLKVRDVLRIVVQCEIPSA